MAKYASNVVKQAKAWLGKNETDGTHRAIIDIYNSHKPLARGYKMTYTDAWCAAFVSAVAIKLGYTDIIPTECGCVSMIKRLKEIGSFVENDAYVPKPGDLIFYDWDDTGRGDSNVDADHVGIVERVNGGVITVIEGNYKNAVTIREIAVNGKYIRGFGVPKYDKEVAPAATSEKNLVEEFQTAAIADGLPLNVYGADGIWGNETANAASKLVQNGSVGNRVKLIQALLIEKGFNLRVYGADGHFGSETDSAVKAFQKKNGLEVDGIVGINTWKSLLGV